MTTAAAKTHPMQKFFLPAAAVLVVGMLIVCFLAGAVYGKMSGEDKRSASWYNATRNSLHVMRELDVANKHEELSSFIHKLDQRLVTELPRDADEAVVEVTKEFNK
jgi:hypothetical protein